MSAKKLLGVTAALLLILAACGDDDDASSSDTSVSDEVDTPQLAFDGIACTNAGRAEVTDGAVVVELVNASDDNANVFVAKIDEDYTVDDVVDATEDPGMTWPTWLTDMGGLPPADPGETMAREGNLDAGQYALLCTQHSAPAWFGSGLTVVEG